MAGSTLADLKKRNVKAQFEGSDVESNEYSNIRANIHAHEETQVETNEPANNPILETSKLPTPEPSQMATPEQTKLATTKRRNKETNELSQEPTTVLAREELIRSKVEQMEEAGIITTTLRIPKRADNYIEKYLLRWNQMYAKPKQRMTKQDVFAAALAGWMIDNPLPKDIDETEE